MHTTDINKRKLFITGGLFASVILIAFAIGAIAMGFSGRSEVRSSLKRENIAGTPDMNKSAIRDEIKQAGLKNVTGVPTCNVAGKSIDTGSEAKCFASYMRIHALEATGGKTYAEMPRYATKDGKGTNNPKLALKDAKGQPVSNPTRELWVTETALSNALNTSFFAERVALFSIIMGVALLLTGIGFLVVVSGVLWKAREATGPDRAAHPSPLGSSA